MTVTDLHHSIPIDASPAKVYQAVSTQDGFRGWWTADTTADARVGGKAEFGFDDRGMVFRMKIEALDPGKRVRLSCSGDHPEWKGTVLEWEVSGKGKTTMLSFVHRGWKEMTPFCATCNTTWGELMFRLKSYAESGTADPHWKR
jgi:uncharacterized protein YndB with AHSA1/START domain